MCIVTGFFTVHSERLIQDLAAVTRYLSVSGKNKGKSCVPLGLTQTCFMTGDIRSLRYITTGYLCHLSESVCPLETYSTLTYCTFAYCTLTYCTLAYCTLTVHSPTVHSPTVHSFMYSIYMLQTLYMCYCSVDFLSVYAQMRSNQLTRSIHQ